MSQIRKGQVITIFGPGAIYVDSNGVSTLISGVDYWFIPSGESPEKYIIQDKRLSTRLNVDHFRLPPDYQKKDMSFLNGKRKTDITPLAAYRFPAWHVCSACNRLQQVSPEEKKSYLSCNREKCKGKVYQVRFIAACSNGHLQEFPWREWVHKDINPTCNGDMELKGSGGALNSIRIHCSCGRSRSLAGITRFNEDPNEGNYSTLSNELQNGALFKCSCSMPWLGINYNESEKIECQKPLVGMLRQATNLFFPKLMSSLKIPFEAEEKLTSLIEKIDEKFSIHDIVELQNSSENILLRVLKGEGINTEEISIDEIYTIFDRILNRQNKEPIDDGDNDVNYRRDEREFLIRNTRHEDLKSNVLNIEDFCQSKFNQFFSIITKIERLTETRALYGIDRIHTSKKNIEQYYQTICRYPLPESKRWLPAICTYGEGIYLEFNQKTLIEWEQSNIDWLERRIASLRINISNSLLIMDSKQVTAKYLLVHTFAHILINALVFECGYSSAALRERLYVSSSIERPMAGVLIYTAAGDTEGSLGGLMAMSDPKRLISVVLKALNEARWCSSDPICTESGESGGQGPNSMNLAACHNCVLLPETSCEHMNMLLDRRLLVSECKDGKGFFDKMID